MGRINARQRYSRRRPASPAPPPEPPPPRWRVESLNHQVLYPPRRITRLLGGLLVQIADRIGQVLHEVRCHPAGFTLVRRVRSVPREFVTKGIPRGGYCRPCKSTECIGVRYAMTIMPTYLPEDPGFEETL